MDIHIVMLSSFALTIPRCVNVYLKCALVSVPYAI